MQESKKQTRGYISWNKKNHKRVLMFETLIFEK